MIRRPLILAIVLGASVVACGPKKKPKPPEPEPETSATAETPPPPPPPKCEKLEEKCTAKGGKKAKIPQSVLVFEPVGEWVYAQGEKVTIAQSSDEDACIGLVGYEVDVKDPATKDPKEKKKLEAAYQAQLDAIAAELKLSIPKGTKVTWGKPENYDKGKVPLHRWIVEKVGRGSKKGDLLVVSTKPNDGKAIFGVGFVPEKDDKSGDKIVAAFDSIAPGDAK
jgi:hypothetical protein